MKEAGGAVHEDDRLAIDLARSENRLIRALITIRQSRGIKPVDLARKMGVDRSVVTRFETGGTNPTMGTINRYAEAVGAMIRYHVEERTTGHDEPSKVTYLFKARVADPGPALAARGTTPPADPAPAFSPWTSVEVR